MNGSDATQIAGIRPDESETKSLDTRPVCDVCDKPVAQFFETYDSFARRVVYVARCHGDSERIDVTEAELEAMRGIGSMSFGRAFVGAKRIGSGA